MRKLSMLCVLASAAVILAGCGIFDLDGSNARAEAQAYADAEYERTKQTVIEHAALRAIEAERTEAARAYYAYLAGQNAGGGPEAARAGTDHNGGITAALSVGAGIGWPVIAVVGLGLLLLALLFGARQHDHF